MQILSQRRELRDGLNILLGDITNDANYHSKKQTNIQTRTHHHYPIQRERGVKGGDPYHAWVKLIIRLHVVMISFVYLVVCGDLEG